MAALPYIQLYVADYLADTQHLSTEEHGAYMLLIFSYWQTGKPLKVSKLQALTRMYSERWTDAEETLSEFFTHVDDVWIHARIEEDLEKVRVKSKKNSDAGKASALARALKKQAESNGRSTDVKANVPTKAQPESNHTDTDTDTDTDTEAEVIKTITPAAQVKWNKKHFADELIKLGADVTHVNDWMASRKTFTETAFKSTIKHINNTDKTVAQIVELCAEKGWKGFDAKYLEGLQQNSGAGILNFNKPDRLATPDRSELFAKMKGEQDAPFYNPLAIDGECYESE